MACGVYLTTSSPYIRRLGFPDADVPILTGIIEAASRAIERYTNRRFLTDTYDETYRPNSMGSIVLNQYPVRSITRVYDRLMPVLAIRNNSASVSNASYSITSTGLLLNHVMAGESTSTNLTYQLHATIGDLVEAINELGFGWLASVNQTYEAFAASDLEKSQFGNCKLGADVQMWLEADDSYFTLDKDIGICEGPFNRGQWLRFVYIAGYDDDLPEDIRACCSEIVRQLYTGSTIPAGQNLGGYSYSIMAESADRIVLSYKQILNLYRDRRV